MAARIQRREEGERWTDDSRKSHPANAGTRRDHVTFASRRVSGGPRLGRSL